MSNITRRDLFKVGGTLVGGAALTGCSLFSTEPGTKSSAAPVDAAAKESPMLAAQVKAGKLPPLEQRLPKSPLVVKPFASEGKYGGTLRTGRLDQNANGIQDWNSAGLVEWTKAVPPEPQPGMAEKYEVLDGGKTYEFVLREGLKWSDGKPFTTADIKFWYEKVLLNKDLNPDFPQWMTSGGKPGKIVVVDARTVRFVFEAPHGLLLRYMCFPSMAGACWHPEHYLKQFHPDYIGAAQATALAKKAGFDTWVDYWDEDRNDQWANPERPVLGPWRLTQKPSAAGTAAAERNPYYWKTDPSGRQLPYIDKLSWVFLERDAFALRAANGDIDLVAAEITYKSAPLLLRNAKDRGYKVLRWKLDGSHNSVHVNQSHPDPVLRKLYQNIDFRAGLSHAINREEINQALLAGQGQIMHPCGTPGDTYFEEGMGKRFIEHDTGKANELLDKAGLTTKDADGFRLRPDGKPLLMRVLTFPVGNTLPEVDVLQYAKKYWAQVGINLAIRNVTRELFYEEEKQGKYDLAGYSASGYLWDIDPLWYVPTAPETYWAPLYGLYTSTGGKQGLKPEGVAAEILALYEKMKQATDDQIRIDLGKQILRKHDENVFVIGLARIPFQPVVASAKLTNVLDDTVSSFRSGTAAATEPVQLYFSQ